LKYVYLLESIADPTQRYVGLAFSREKAAVDFERYLKTASGRAFANKRLR